MGRPFLISMFLPEYLFSARILIQRLSNLEPCFEKNQNMALSYHFIAFSNRITSLPA